MVQYFPVVTGSLTVTGSINVSGGITASGGISISGSIASASFASTSSFVALAQSASNAVAAATASFADAFTVAGNLTAQTLVVQTITSSVDFVTGSTRFGSIIGNTHVFTGSMLVSGSNINITSAGVGINATPSGYRLNVGGGAAVSNILVGSGYRVEFADAGSTSWAWIEGSSYDQGYSYISFNTSGSEKMRLTSAGNLGIGTNSPTSKLHIINNTDGFVGRFTGGAASTVTAGIYANSTTGFASIGVQSNHQFRIFTNDADRLTVTSGGDIGVGTTSPSQKVHIMGSTGLPATSGTSQVGTLRLQLSGYGTVLDFGGEGPATGKQWIQVTDASNLSITYPLLLNPNGGNVSIGTTSASATKLQVYAAQNYGTINDQLNLEGGVGGGTPTNPAYYGGMRFTGNGYSWGAIRSIQVNPSATWYNRMAFFTMDGAGGGLLERMAIDNQGYVGIGTSSPGFKLDISQGSPDIFRITNTGSATGNNPAAQFLHTYGNHSWGILAEFRVGASGGTDSPSILFSQGYNSNTWAIGFGYSDTTYFRINKDQGPYSSTWGTTLFSMDRSGNYSFAGSNVSDRRNKKDITYITDSQLDTILKLKPASFNKKSPGKNEYSDNVHTGFIAQDILEENIPNLVHGNEEEGYGLDYDGVLALTVKALQELNTKFEEYKATHP